MAVGQESGYQDESFLPPEVTWDGIQHEARMVRHEIRLGKLQNGSDKWFG